MSSSDLISLLLTSVTFILGNLIPGVFYKAPFYIRFSLCKRMMLVNLYTAMWVFFTLKLIVLNPYCISHVWNTLIPACLWALLFAVISIIYYGYFYREAHYKCPHCGSRNTVKTDDSDGEYLSMGFHCKNCNKGFTIGRSCSGGWPD